MCRSSARTSMRPGHAALGAACGWTTSREGHGGQLSPYGATSDWRWKRSARAHLPVKWTSSWWMASWWGSREFSFSVAWPRRRPSTWSMPTIWSAWDWNGLNKVEKDMKSPHEKGYPEKTSETYRDLGRDPVERNEEVCSGIGSLGSARACAGRACGCSQGLSQSGGQDQGEEGAPDASCGRHFVRCDDLGRRGGHPDCGETNGKLSALWSSLQSLRRGLVVPPCQVGGPSDNQKPMASAMAAPYSFKAAVPTTKSIRRASLFWNLALLQPSQLRLTCLSLVLVVESGMECFLPRPAISDQPCCPGRHDADTTAWSTASDGWVLGLPRGGMLSNIHHPTDQCERGLWPWEEVWHNKAGRFDPWEEAKAHMDQFALHTADKPQQPDKAWCMWRSGLSKGTWQRFSACPRDSLQCWANPGIWWWSELGMAYACEKWMDF